MENFNKTWPFITAVVGFGILLFAIFSFINGAKRELNARMDRVETKIHNVRTELKTDIREVKTELNARIDRIEERMEARMDNIEGKMEGIEGKLDQLILLQAQSMSPHKPIRALPNKKAKRKPAQAR